MIYEMYPLINSTISANMNNDLTEIFRYADLITDGWTTNLICLSFFIVAFLGSMMAQQRFAGNIRPEISLLAASFVTLGLEAIMMQKDLVDLPVFGITLFITIISFVWVTTSTSETG